MFCSEILWAHSPGFVAVPACAVQGVVMAGGFRSPILEKAALFLQLKGLSANAIHFPYQNATTFTWVPGSFYSRDLLISLSENKNQSLFCSPVIFFSFSVSPCASTVLLSRGPRGLVNAECDAPMSTRKFTGWPPIEKVTIGSQRPKLKEPHP